MAILDTILQCGTYDMTFFGITWDGFTIRLFDLALLATKKESTKTTWHDATVDFGLWTIWQNSMCTYWTWHYLRLLEKGSSWNYLTWLYLELLDMTLLGTTWHDSIWNYLTWLYLELLDMTLFVTTWLDSTWNYLTWLYLELLDM